MLDSVLLAPRLGASVWHGLQAAGADDMGALWRAAVLLHWVCREKPMRLRISTLNRGIYKEHEGIWSLIDVLYRISLEVVVLPYPRTSKSE